MNTKSTGSPLRTLPLAWLLAAALVTTVFTIGDQISAAQSADTDGDGYADEVEEELGSNFTNVDSTPEHFSLLWSCTDGNDNDKDGTRDFADQSCRLAGSPAPTPAPTPAATATPGPTATPGAGGGSGPGGGGSSGSGDSGGGGQGGTDGSETSETGSDGSDGGDQGSGAGIGSAGSTSGGEGGSTADGGDDASGGGDSGGGGGFPWMLLLLILAAVLTAAAICYALFARRQARSRSYRMTKP